MYVSQTETQQVDGNDNGAEHQPDHQETKLKRNRAEHDDAHSAVYNTGQGFEPRRRKQSKSYKEPKSRQHMSETQQPNRPFRQSLVIRADLDHFPRPRSTHPAPDAYANTQSAAP